LGLIGFPFPAPSLRVRYNTFIVYENEDHLKGSRWKVNLNGPGAAVVIQLMGIGLIDRETLSCDTDLSACLIEMNEFETYSIVRQKFMGLEEEMRQCSVNYLDCTKKKCDGIRRMNGIGTRRDVVVSAGIRQVYGLFGIRRSGWDLNFLKELKEK
jgi:hypothetical protein